MHCYYTFFTRPNVIFFKSLVLLDYFKVIKELTFLMYLSMPIDNVTWQARVWIFNSSKPLFKTKIKNRGMLQFLLHHIEYSLYFFLTFILITRVQQVQQVYLYQVSSRLIKNIPASFCLFSSKQQILLCFCCFSFKICCLVVMTLKKTLDLSIHL